MLWFQEPEERPGEDHQDEEVEQQLPIDEIINEAWASVMHGTSHEEQMEGWSLLEERLKKLNIGEVSEVKHTTRFGDGINVFDPAFPTATQSAFARCVARCTDEEIDNLLNAIHDSNFHKDQLKWKSAKQMKTFLAKSADRLGSLEVTQEAIRDGEPLPSPPPPSSLCLTISLTISLT